MIVFPGEKKNKEFFEDIIFTLCCITKPCGSV